MGNPLENSIASVTSVAHGLTVGQEITSPMPGTGAVLDGVHVITATGDDTFTFTTTEVDRARDRRKC